MSTEQIDPQLKSAHLDSIEEDPLEELARIVSGEVDSSLESAVQLQDDAFESEVSIDANLMQELAAEQGTVDETQPTDGFAASIQEQLEAQLAEETANALPDPEPLPEPEPIPETAIEVPQLEQDFGESFAEEELVSENLAHQPQEIVEEPVELTVEPQAEIAASMDMNVPAFDEEAAFQDDLIEALQEEIAPSPPEFESLPGDDNDVLPGDNDIVYGVEEGSADPFFDGYGDDSNMDYSPNAEVTADGTGPISITPSDVTEEFAASSDILAEPEAVELPAVLAHSEISEPLAEEPLTSENETEITAADIDFGAAFAEELGMDNVEEAQGWTAPEDTQELDDFALAAQSAGYQPVIENVSIDETANLDDPQNAEAELAAFDENQNEKSGGGLKYAMAALVIALFAGAITAGYGFLGTGDDAQVAQQAKIIRADSEPIKVKPENPGGRIPDNQDKASYGKVEGIEEEVGQSSLLSNTEEPAVIDISNASQEAIDQAQSSLAATGANNNKSDDRLGAGADVENALATVNSAVAPKRVQTLVIKPDGTVIDRPSSAISTGTQQFAASSSDLGLTRVPDATPKQVTTTSVKATQPINPEAATQGIGTANTAVIQKPATAEQQPATQPLKKVVTPKPKPSPSPTQTAAPARSQWVVQIASQTSAEAAQTSFQNMRRQFSALQNRSMSVQRAAVNGTTYYRVRVQTASRSDANQLCSRLTSQGGSCFVTR